MARLPPLPHDRLPPSIGVGVGLSTSFGGPAPAHGLLVVLRVLASAAVLVSALWGVLALHFQWLLEGIGGTPVLWLVSAAWLALHAAVLARLWQRRTFRALLWFVLAWLLMGCWWQGIEPSNDRPWAEDVARYMEPSVQGQTVHLAQVRNFDWRSETSWNARWEPRSYDLARIRSVDVGTSYWMGPAIAHTLVSFGMDDGRYLTFSVEIRKEKGESFSALAGFFKRYETSLIAADERDILRVRTNVRGEDVFLYRVFMPQDAMQSLFLAYVQESQTLQQEPSFYNTLTANCTTIVFEMAKRIVPGLPLDWRLLASGYLPQYLHSVGALAPGVGMNELQASGRITERAKAADGITDSAAFSRAIRQGMPGVPTDELVPAAPARSAVSAGKNPRNVRAKKAPEI